MGLLASDLKRLGPLSARVEQHNLNPMVGISHTTFPQALVFPTSRSGSRYTVLERRLIAGMALRPGSAPARHAIDDVDDLAIFNLTYLEIGETFDQRTAACDAVVFLIGFVVRFEPSKRSLKEPQMMMEYISTTWVITLAC